MTYTHTHGARTRWMEFSDGILSNNKPAGRETAQGCSVREFIINCKGFALVSPTPFLGRTCSPAAEDLGPSTSKNAWSKSDPKDSLPSLPATAFDSEWHTKKTPKYCPDRVPKGRFETQ